MPLSFYGFKNKVIKDNELYEKIWTIYHEETLCKYPVLLKIWKAWLRENNIKEIKK